MSRLTAETAFKKDPKEPVVPEPISRSMYDLYIQYYDGTSWEIFYGDLKNKDFVIILRDDQHQLKGFSTLALLEFEFNGQPRRALFSGDTIIHNDYWGEQTLPMAWCRLAGRVKAQKPDLPLYWFLIVKGYRTYRYLPVFGEKFYPTWRYPTPPEHQALMDYLAGEKFGEHYSPNNGLVKFPTSRGHLREQWAEIKDNFREKPDIKYFLERNPEYYKGHELVCFAEITESNMRKYAKRAFLEGKEMGEY